MTELGKRIKQAREHAGLTQAELARKLNLSQSTIASVERRNESSIYSTAIADALNVNAVWLALGKGSMLDSEGSTAPVAPAHSPAVQPDDEQVLSAVRWFAAQIKDKHLKKAALARCVSVMNQAFLEDSSGAQSAAASALQQRQDQPIDRASLVLDRC